jgi:hypothetical protein
MLVHKVQIGDGDLYNSLADGTSKSSQKITAHPVTVCSGLGLPNYRAQLQR